MPSNRKVRCSICGLLHNKDEIRKTRSGNYICINCIETSNGRFVECEECHVVEEKYISFALDEDDNETIDISTIRGKNICNTCRRRYYYRCSCCNEYERISNLLEIKGRFVCPSCRNTRFYTCDDCGEFEYENDLITIHENHKVCNNCKINYARCDYCGDWTRISEGVTTTNYNTICRHCAEAYYEECENCHRYARRGELEEDTIDGEIIHICEHCMNANGESVIYNYHRGEEFVKKTVPEDKENEKLFIGMELEVAGNRSVARRFLRLFQPQNIMLMNDASVAGFEIVTMPMTYKYIMKEFIPQLKRGLSFLIEKGFKGHNKGGLHIHVSDEAISKTQVAQLAEILYGNKNDKETWRIISQRKQENIHWCSFEGNKPFYQISEATVDKPSVTGNRHTALNYDCSRTHTYEFRIFNSSLRIDRILKNLECVIALLDYTKQHEDKERPTCNTTDFLDYVMAKRIFYPNLVAFLEEKQLVIKHKLKDYTEINDEDEERIEQECA